MKSSSYLPVSLVALCCVFSVLGASEGITLGTIQLASTVETSVDMPNATYSGYLTLSEGSKDALFYAYYEAQEASATEETPILLWLEVCARVNSPVHTIFSESPSNSSADVVSCIGGSWMCIHAGKLLYPWALLA